MAQTLANMASVEKDVWTSQELAKSFYDHNKLLARMRQVQATVIGLQAQVAVQKWRGVGGYTSTDAAGGSRAGFGGYIQRSQLSSRTKNI